MQWRAHKLVLDVVTRPLLALDLADYTKEQCLVAADTLHLPDHTGRIAAILYARCGRGAATLEDARVLALQAMNGYMRGNAQE